MCFECQVQPQGCLASILTKILWYHCRTTVLKVSTVRGNGGLLYLCKQDLQSFAFVWALRFSCTNSHDITIKNKIPNVNHSTVKSLRSKQHHMPNPRRGQNLWGLITYLVCNHSSRFVCLDIEFSKRKVKQKKEETKIRPMEKVKLKLRVASPRRHFSKTWPSLFFHS